MFESGKDVAPLTDGYGSEGVAPTPGRACWSRLCLVLPNRPLQSRANACTGLALLAEGMAANHPASTGHGRFST